MPPGQKFNRYGQVDCLERTTGDGPFTVILFHGYGADASDLASLHEVMDHPMIGRWIFPNGIIGASGLPFGRAWFPIDLMAMEKAMQTGDFRDFSQMPAGLNQAIAAANTVIDKAGLDPQYTFIGGFSQGAMLATAMAMNSPARFAGIGILSGTFLGAKEWIQAEPKNPHVFFQSHGKQDMVLPFSGAEKLYNVLRSGGWKGGFLPFSGGHEIPQSVIAGLTTFLDTTMALVQSPQGS
mgnify:FL=1